MEIFYDKKSIGTFTYSLFFKKILKTKAYIGRQKAFFGMHIKGNENAKWIHE